ncbi:hypothetical protein AB6A40_004993 [Gnathostoma spinigerum]|uniref:G-protein coupled receptors family 1 profile domain-containing protein n=1 Tax=Gnathostoma spinigerum TaxID=75299 RepID=A0ABD6EE50_9BILA
MLETQNQSTSLVTAQIDMTHNTNDIKNLTFYASVLITVESSAALIINLYLLNCSRYLRHPAGINVQLCVSLMVADAACAVFYMTSNFINVIIPTILHQDDIVSHCISLLVECLKIATFFASVFTLLALALNHYIGIVHPLYSSSITHKAVRTAITFAYILPFVFFIGLYSIVPGGFRNDVAFGFFSMKGCAGGNIMRKFSVRLITVIPFIAFVIIIVSLYVHIVIHMRMLEKNPLIQSGITYQRRRGSNRRLLITILLLAGSAVFGWLPTLLSYVVFCNRCPVRLQGYPLMCLLILCQIINVLKLILDGFVYATRLIEIRFAIWRFHTSFKSYFPGQTEKATHVPVKFEKYLRSTNDISAVAQKRRKTSIRRTRSVDSRNYSPDDGDSQTDFRYQIPAPLKI